MLDLEYVGAGEVQPQPRAPFKFKGGAKGDKVQITWTDNRGEKRTDEATIG